MKHFLATMASGLALFLGLALPAWACDCPDTPLEEQVADADLVAHVRITDTSQGTEDTVDYQADVLKVWKGPQDPSLRILTEMGPSLGYCGFAAEDGDEFLLIARQNGDSYQTSFCAGSTSIEQADEEAITEILGDPVTPTVEPAPSDPDEPNSGFAAWLIGGSLIVLVSVGALVLLNRNRAGDH